jgi:hypothetical protein
MSSRGQCQSRCCGGTCVLVGVTLFFVGLFAPKVIDNMVNDRLCDKVCIPRKGKESDEAFEMWRTNDNPKENPIENWYFHLFNITNLVEVVENGTKPVVETVGPYVYRMRRENFNIAYKPGDEVWYEQFTTFSFIPNASVGPDTDVFINVDTNFLAAFQFAYERKGDPDSAAGAMNANCQGDNPPNKAPYIPSTEDQACLFRASTVRQAIFGQHSHVAFMSNLMMFGERPLDTQFSYLFNASSAEEAHNRSVLLHNFGLGGSCREIQTGPIDMGVVCDAPRSHEARIRAKTGHGKLEDTHRYTAFFGNQTILWANDTQVDGTDHYQFSPGLKEGQPLRVFDDTVLRSLDLVYKGNVPLLGINLFRYTTADSVFANDDPVYRGPGPKGLLSGRDAAYIRYGASAPIYGSQPYFFGADENLTEAFTCVNCPILHDDNWTSYQSVVDVEPYTGKVLSGAKRAQFNALLGQDYLFGTPDQYDEQSNPWARVPDVYLPIFWFEQKAEMNQEQAKLARDGISQIKMAHAAKTGLRYTGLVLGALSVVFGIFTLARWYSKRQAVRDDSINHDYTYSAY